MKIRRGIACRTSSASERAAAPSPTSQTEKLLKACKILTRDQSQVRRCLRQMIFNILAHNRDDHVESFSFILDHKTGAWALSPAYALTFARGPGGEHSMTVAGEGRHPTRQDVLKLADQADIAWGDAERIIDEVSDAVNAWQSIAQEVGVQKRPSGRSLAP